MMNPSCNISDAAKVIFLMVALWIGSDGLFAQPTDTLSLEEYYDIPLDQMDDLTIRDTANALDEYINDQVSIAGQKTLSSRYSPSIITVITEEEIRNSGARDLIDVLRQVPGMAFGLDEEGRVGIGIRGNWANEGKVLLMIDGQEVNDIYSAGVSFGNHYPVELIKKIEIIRGPGAVNYGGFAEFGVINVITYNGDDYSGFKMGLTQGYMKDVRGRNVRNFYFGKNWKKLTVNFSVFRGKGQRSDQDHYAFYYPRFQDSIRGAGAYSSLAGESHIDPAFTNFQVKLGRFTYKSLVDFYDITDITDQTIDFNRPIRKGVRTTYNEFTYDWKVNDKLTISPKYQSVLQFPEFKGQPDSLDQSENRISRNKVNLTANYDPNHRTSILIGTEGFRDFAQGSLNRVAFPVGIEDVTYYNFAGFAQGLFRTPFAYIVAGMRYDYNSSFGSAFVPRLAITKRMEKFHFKVLGAGSFRAPSIGNYARSFTGTYTFNSDTSGIRLTNRGLNPEKTFMIELELGYQFSPNLFLTVNAFDTYSQDPIYYSFYQDSAIAEVFGAAAGANLYRNDEKSGTRGFEVDLRYKSNWGSLQANYAFYTTQGKKQIFDHSVNTFNFDWSQRRTVNNNQLLVFAPHRINVHANINLTKKLTGNLTGSFFSQRYGYDVLLGDNPLDVSGQLIKIPSTLLTNVYFRYKDFLIPGMDLGVGVYDLFDQKFVYYQPFFGIDTPMPGPSREFVINLSLKIGFEDEKKDRR